MPYRLWDLLSEEDKHTLLVNFKGLRSPPELGRLVSCDVKLESIEEIDRLMRIPTKGKAAILHRG